MYDVLGNLEIPTIELILQIALALLPSALACVILWRRTEEPLHRITWGIISWLVPYPGTTGNSGLCIDSTAEEERLVSLD